MDRPSDIIQQISRSEIYKDYERAFSDSTQLSLRPVEIWNAVCVWEGARQDGEGPIASALGTKI